ncbi:MAG: ATP-dependent DNA helicase RecG [Catalinimonas sp.]
MEGVDNYLRVKIGYLKGFGPQRAQMLSKELGLFTCGDLLQHYPFRHEDRSRFYTVAELNEDMPMVQVRGRLVGKGIAGEGHKKRLVAVLRDEEERDLELVWFKAINWMDKRLRTGTEYVAFGRPAAFGSKFSIAHPELEPLEDAEKSTGHLQPVYHTTEVMKRRYLDSRTLSRLMRPIVGQAWSHVPETLPDALVERYRFISKADAIRDIHFPADADQLQRARYRLKYEELFYVQLKLLQQQTTQRAAFAGHVCGNTELLTKFYEEHLPFDLTGAQKRVIREIFKDFRSGKQMNRLLQGDVGSGKTIVAFIAMLLAIGSGYQTCLMAPTEILADQHYRGLLPLAEALGVGIGKLTGSTTKKQRTRLDERVQLGMVKILVGTHALLEDWIELPMLGFVVIDEQHRFGVAQRARLWGKTARPPHVLVMTATPIPRTLAMTVYGDLDVSVIDELPPGRKPVATAHRYEKHRLRVFGFLKEQIELGRQVYIVYPLVEESDKLKYKDVTEGYESISRAFPGVPISILHGRMHPQDKDFEMQRFVKGETKIMVATTVIEVGVNVPNASVMVIEDAEKFGLAQLHQLRGRVGRGAEQSYCILMTDYKLTKEARARLEAMCRTNDGFEIADLDLKLRGPGDLTGTQQSGVLDLLIADLAKDGELLQQARADARTIIESDPRLEQPPHAAIRRHIDSLRKESANWSRIS